LTYAIRTNIFGLSNFAASCPSVWDLVFGRYMVTCMDVAESDWLLDFYVEVECGGLCLFGGRGGEGAPISN
jgi:hypothetical protein